MIEVILESTLQLIYPHNPDFVQGIINTYTKKEVNGIVYFTREIKLAE